ncbi:MAG: winged helix DNA-binding domain-containing protein [Solirubrobacteraceae bacterium]
MVHPSGTPVLPARLSAQLLAGPAAAGPVEATRRLLAVQAQDPRGVRLAIRARTPPGSVTAFERELTDARSLVVTWLNRGTLHLVAAEDYFWLHALSAPPLFTANARRLTEEGVSPAAAERGVTVIERALGHDGPLSRAQLRERLQAAGVPTAGQALVHVLMLASLRGLAVRGPMSGGEHAYVLVRDWLGEPPAVDRDHALAELARRYLAGHAPAGERDLVRWSGLTLRDARAGLGAIAAELVEREDGLLELTDTGPPAPCPPPRLLGAYEPVLLGWRSREFLVGTDQVVFTVNGLFRPFALVRGRAAATWRLRGGKVSIEPLDELAADDAAALERDAKDVLSYLAVA